MYTKATVCMYAWIGITMILANVYSLVLLLLMIVCELVSLVSEVTQMLGVNHDC